MDSYCDAWNSASPEKLGLASSLTASKLLGQEEFSCSNRFAVLCIEVTTQASKRRRRDVGEGYYLNVTDHLRQTDDPTTEYRNSLEIEEFFE